MTRHPVPNGIGCLNDRLLLTGPGSSLDPPPNPFRHFFDVLLVVLPTSYDATMPIFWVGDLVHIYSGS